MDLYLYESRSNFNHAKLWFLRANNFIFYAPYDQKGSLSDRRLSSSNLPNLLWSKLSSADKKFIYHSKENRLNDSLIKINLINTINFSQIMKVHDVKSATTSSGHIFIFEFQGSDELVE